MMKSPFALGMILAAGLTSSAALATWSILLVDTRTGEMAIGSATCLVNFDLEANSPVVVVGKGIAAAQSTVDVTGINRTHIRDGFIAGLSPAQILAQLAMTDGDHESRQYGMLDVRGRGVTFTGMGDSQWAGGLYGRFNYTYAGKTGEIVYAIQGNILTGADVVQGALDAIRSTDGDLPARLMAGMEAARGIGGDMRCSCSGGPVCPDPGFTKAADCGYFIISRDGDANSMSVSFGSAGTGPVCIADLNGDHRPELIVPMVGGTAPSNFLVFSNTTPAGSLDIHLATPVSYPCVVNPAIAAAGDLSGDGFPEVFIAGGSTATGAVGALTLYRGGIGGVLSNRSDFATTRRGLGVAFGDFDGLNGQDIAYCTATQVFVQLNLGGGVLGDPVLLGTPTSPGSLFVADINSDGKADVCLGSGSPALRYFPGHGDGTFGTLVSITAAATLRAAAAGDFNHDGITDVAMAPNTSPQAIVVKMGTGGGSFGPTVIVDNSSLSSSLNIGDVNGDGNNDLVYVDNLARVDVAMGNGNGTFAPAVRMSVPSPVGTLALGDLNGDGQPEAIYNNGTLTVLSNNRGQFGSPTGFAIGNYFLNINIANQPRTNTDPVFQMRTSFDSIRSTLIGVTDAITSTVASVTTLTPQQSTDVVISLRDYTGATITHFPYAVSVQRIGNGPFATSGSTVTTLGGGQFRLRLRGEQIGQDRFTVFVDDRPRRAVTLMPALVINVVKGPTQHIDPQ